MTTSKDLPLDSKGLFGTVNKNFVRTITPDDDHTVIIVTSAIAKCIDFNMVVNKDKDHENRTLPYFLTANSRSICEDLIYLSFMRQQSPEKANDLLKAIHHLKFKHSILAQTRFFLKNNPGQPTYGAYNSIEQQETEIKDLNKGLKDLWKQHDFKKIPPTTKELSLKVGLKATYEYIYHLTSNLVHFQPHHLMQQGWATEAGFEFSPGTFSEYHSALGRFLGAILFLGYCYGYPERFDKNIRDAAIQGITSELKSGIRWPEIVTYEEMNEEPPHPLIRAVIIQRLFEEPAEPLPDIFFELRNLGNNQVVRLK